MHNILLYCRLYSLQTIQHYQNITTFFVQLNKEKKWMSYFSPNLLLKLKSFKNGNNDNL